VIAFDLMRRINRTLEEKLSAGSGSGQRVQAEGLFRCVDPYPGELQKPLVSLQEDR
jgi:hypothetical protein